MKTARVAFAGALHDAVPHADGLQLADGRVLAETQVVWLPPFDVGTVIAPGLNYANHVKELSRELTVDGQGRTLVFLKGSGALLGHRGTTKRPRRATFMHYECKLAVVIGKPGKRMCARRCHPACRRLHGLQRLCGARRPGELVPADPARQEPRRRHGTRPWFVDAADVADPHALRLQTRVNGRVVQQGSTADMVHDIPDLVAYLSGFMTLLGPLSRRRRDRHALLPAVRARGRSTPSSR